MTNQFLKDIREQAIQRARELVERPLLVLDTETTGLGPDAEICEIALVTVKGTPILNTLVKPSVSIPADAVAIHGIDDAMVSQSLALDQLVPTISEALYDVEAVVIYNADFDVRLLNQSCKSVAFDELPWNRTDARKPAIVCAMELYAEYYGDWSEYHGSSTWQSLSNAAHQCLLSWEGDAHRALADAQMTASVLRFMAKAEVGS